MKYVSKVESEKISHAVLEEVQGGWDLFLYERADSEFPEWDYFLESLECAKDMAEEDFGVRKDSWKLSE